MNAICKRCGSNQTTEIIMKDGPHYSKVVCKTCGAFIKWGKKPHIAPVERHEISLSDGKYKIIYQPGGNGAPHIFKALRYGEEWRDLTGDGMVLELVFKIIELQGSDSK